MQIFPLLRNRAVLISLGLAIALAFLAFAVRISYQDVRLINQNGLVESVTLPINRESVGGPQTFIVDGHLLLGALAPKVFRIIPDDRVIRIEINNLEVPLSSFTPDELGNWSSGFTIDLSEFLRSGKNSFQITYQDIGEPGLTGIAIKNGGIFWYWLLVLAALALSFPMWLKLLKILNVNSTHAALYALITVGGLVRVFCIFIYNPVNHIGSDAERHWESGIDVLRVDLMTMTDPIMYQLYMSWLAKLSLKIPELVAFYTSILSLVTPWIWYRFFRELQNNKTVALAGWACLALLPSWVSIYSYFMQETLMLPLLGAALWSTWRARRKQTVAAFTLMVGLWIAVGLTRGIAVPFAAICCTWLWLLQDSKVKKAVYSSILLLLVMGPLTYRSYVTVQQFAPHGMGHLAAIYGMSGKREILLHTTRDGARWSHIFGSPSTGAEPFAPLSDWRTQREGQVIVSVDFRKGSEDWDKAYDSVAMTWDRFAWITKENLIFLFFASSWPDNNLSRIIDKINVGMRWIWAPATLLIAAIIFARRRHLQGEWLLPSLLLAWFFVQGLLPISVNEGRYRKPFEGMLIAQCVLLLGLRRKYGKDSNELGDSGTQADTYMSRSSESTDRAERPA